MVERVVMQAADPEASEEAKKKADEEALKAGEQVDISGTKRNADGSEESVAVEADVKEEEKDDIAGAAAEAQLDVPEKFQNEDGSLNVEALLKSQQELEKQFTQERQNQEKADESTTEKAEESEETSEEAGTEAGESKEQVVVRAREEFIKDGKLSEETYKGLEASGYTKDEVDTYIKGLVAQAAEVQQQVLGPIGGIEEYDKLVDWGNDNFTDEEKKEFNDAVFGEDVKLAKATVAAAYARYQREADVEPEKVLEGGLSQDAGEGYASQAEMLRDMAKPEYKTDPAFRNKVSRKIARAKVNLFEQ
jgi:hypothetical protein